MKKYLLIILALSIATHFAFFGHPNETVFDEVHFGKFVSGYYTEEYYFDIHPPLGKMVIAGFAKIVDFKPEYNFTEIGKEFPDNKYLALRLLPTIAGTLLPLIIFLLILELGMSRIAAFAGALLAVFDNALLAQSRLILLDPFLLLFGFTSLLFYFRYYNQSNKKHSNILQSSFDRLQSSPGVGDAPLREKHGQETTPRKNVGMFFVFRKWNSNLFLMAVFGGLAISIKWTGLSFIALPIAIESYGRSRDLLTNLSYDKFVSNILGLTKLASFLLISLAIYFSVFALHFALLPNPGSGDAFMKPDFRENNIVRNIRDLNIEMYKSNQRLSASHPYSSQWYTWPLMTRPIFYWVKDTARIYSFGNPIIWWGSAIAVAISIKYLVLSIKLRKPDKILIILLSGYALNMLPFIGVKRVMFLYHYLTALIFAIMIFCYLIDKNPFDSIRIRKNSRKIFTGIIIAAIAAFLFFAPLTYGLPLSDKAYNARVWFANWR